MTVNKSQKAALFVFLSLLAALIAGLVLYFVYSGRTETAVPLLAGSVLVAFGLVVATARLVTRYRRSERLAETNGVRKSRMLHLLELRQWLVLLVGVTVVAIATGALTGVRVLSADPVRANPQPTTAVSAPAVPAPVTATTGAPTVSASPSSAPTSDGPDPSSSADPSDSPSGAPTVTHGTITYLDSASTLAGRYDAKAVAFAAARYPRGISFYCNTATSSFLQWNVAGYDTFTATAGIDDDTANAFGLITEYIFYDQDGRQLVPAPVDTSVGHPQKITLSLAGVVSLRMTCSGREVKTNRQQWTYGAFGDPKIVSN